jgi:essential nuclear protein 1
MARTFRKISNPRSSQHDKSLADEIISTGILSAKSKKRKAKHEDEEARYVDSRSSRKILKIGQELADEELEDTGTAKPNPAFTFDSRFATEVESDDDAPEMDDDAWGDEDDQAVEEVVRLKSMRSFLSHLRIKLT